MSEYKRLTRRDGEAIWVGRTMYRLDTGTNFGKVMHRLAEYEDIGSPEEFAELAKAKESIQKAFDLVIEDISEENCPFEHDLAKWQECENCPHEDEFYLDSERDFKCWKTILH